MIWAIKDDERMRASPKQRATCPLCDEEVIAKCGSIKIWHWSHKKDFVCDSFGEPETPWHLEWKNYFDKECQEVIIGKHRADIKTEKEWVLEIQNSPISSKKIKEREDYYGKMIWVLNGKTIAKNLKLYGYDKEWNSKKLFWKWFPKSWADVERDVYVDTNDGYLIKTYFDENGVGFGSKISKDAFIIEHGGKPWQKSLLISQH